MTTVEAKPSPAGVPGAVTDTSDLQAEELTFTGSGGTDVNGYLASPAGTEPCAGMIVIHEAGGLNEHIRDICNRLAALGYSALGVDLYTREGGPPPAGDVEAIMKRLFSMSDETVRGDLDGAADHLRGLARASGRVGCIGFCMGGRYTLLMAVTSDRLDAAVDCWGGFVDRATPDERSTPERPTPPLELAGDLHCPLLAAVGAEDHNPSPLIAEQLRERAATSGQEVEVDVYEGAGHAFFADYRPTYRPEPAARLWERIVPFLHHHLQEA
jgi:carboxymethylenebutenolidase